ncbi:hypothetical protein BgiBS90_003190 [Biomphalaria glabrata]|nr:hypothetical protein BgiBS90_003190 [Biomphalaria glabrata]
MSILDAMTTTVSAFVDKLVYVIDKDNHSRSIGSHADGSHVHYLTSQPDMSAVTPSPDLAATENPDMTPGQLKAVTVMVISFSIFGCLGNGLVLYVFSKKNDKVSSTIFILALAWTDFFVCLIFMPFTATYLNLDSVVHFEFFCKLFNFLNTSNVPLSAFLMVAIAVDRYFSICHPFLHIMTPRRAKATILCLVVFAFSLGSITSCLFGIHSYNETLTQYNAHNCNSSFASPRLLYSDTGDNLPWNNFTVTSPGPDNLALCEELRISLSKRDGACLEKYQILSLGFMETYQKIYISFYIISLLSVFTLYFFIYRSVVKRRAWRRKQKSWSHSPMTMTAASTMPATAENRVTQLTYGAEGQTLELSPKHPENNEAFREANGDKTEEREYVADNRLAKTNNSSRPAEMVVVTRNDFANDGVVETSALSSAEKKTIRERRDFNFLANIRTASMLFVVAVVFIVSFLPAWLMAVRLIGYHVIVFYSHFFYNVVNPVIYAFMNQSFRKELKRVFQRECHKLSCHRNRPSYEHGVSRTGMTELSVCESPDDNFAEGYRTRLNTE